MKKFLSQTLEYELSIVASHTCAFLSLLSREADLEVCDATGDK